MKNTRPFVNFPQNPEERDELLSASFEIPDFRDDTVSIEGISFISNGTKDGKHSFELEAIGSGIESLADLFF